MDISKLTRKALRYVSDNSPAILTGMAVVGTLTTATLAATGAVKAERMVQEYHLEHHEEEDYEPLDNRDIFLMTWKNYIPAAAMGLATIACIVSAHTVHNRRGAAIMAAYTLTETAFSEYKEKVIEEVGKQKERKIREEISVDHIKANPPASSQVVMLGEDQTLFRDSLSGRYFKCDMETVRQAVNDINERCIRQDYASLNELYTLLNLEHTALGEELGWMADHLLDVTYGAYMSEDGKPCIEMTYQAGPFRGYYRH